jgi:hypothetical protein
MKEKKISSCVNVENLGTIKKTNLVPRVLTLGDKNFLNIFHHLEK